MARDIPPAKSSAAIVSVRRIMESSEEVILLKNALGGAPVPANPKVSALYSWRISAQEAKQH
jgi:hypothetical protein